MLHLDYGPLAYQSYSHTEPISILYKLYNQAQHRNSTHPSVHIDLSLLTIRPQQSPLSTLRTSPIRSPATLPPLASSSNIQVRSLRRRRWSWRGIFLQHRHCSRVRASSLQHHFPSVRSATGRPTVPAGTPTVSGSHSQ